MVCAVLYMMYVYLCIMGVVLYYDVLYLPHVHMPVSHAACTHASHIGNSYLIVLAKSFFRDFLNVYPPNAFF